MDELILFDSIALLAGLIALYFVLRTQKHFSRNIKPAFQVSITTIGLLMGSVSAKYIVPDNELVAALDKAVIIAILIAVAIAMFIINKRMPWLRAKKQS